MQLSLPEVYSFTTAVKSLVGERRSASHYFWRINQHRRKLKELFIRGLKRLASVQITSPVDEWHSNFILTFRFPGEDNRTVVERLWREHFVMVSYISRSDVIRASFGPLTKMSEVEYALTSLQEVLSVSVVGAKLNDVKVG
jgi:selenocysteine lyase/cysteine desulfurase